MNVSDVAVLLFVAGLLEGGMRQSAPHIAALCPREGANDQVTCPPPYPGASAEGACRARAHQVVCGDQGPSSRVRALAPAQREPCRARAHQVVCGDQVPSSRVRVPQGYGAVRPMTASLDPAWARAHTERKKGKAQTSAVMQESMLKRTEAI